MRPKQHVRGNHADLIEVEPLLAVEVPGRYCQRAGHSLAVLLPQLACQHAPNLTHAGQLAQRCAGALRRQRHIHVHARAALDNPADLLAQALLDHGPCAIGVEVLRREDGDDVRLVLRTMACMALASYPHASHASHMTHMTHMTLALHTWWFGRHGVGGLHTHVTPALIASWRHMPAPCTQAWLAWPIAPPPCLGDEASSQASLQGPSITTPFVSMNHTRPALSVMGKMLALGSRSTLPNSATNA